MADKFYQVGKIQTNLYLKIQFSINERVFKMNVISDGDVTEQEFKRMREIRHQCKLPVIDVEWVLKKKADIKNAKEY